MRKLFVISMIVGMSLQGFAEENQETCGLGFKILQATFQKTKDKQENCGNGPRSMRADVRHIEAGGIGYRHGYTTLEIFLASDPNQWCVTPFLDVRGHMFNNGQRAVNIGIGGRTNWGCRAYGMNVYYDYRNTHRRTYNQIGAGLETLGKLWDLRVNGYFPLGEKVSNPYNIKFGGFSGNSVLVDRTFQYAMTGVDGEIGFHFGKTRNFDFCTAAGPYYFKGRMGKGAIGGKARIAGYFKEYATLEFSDSWDTVFHNNFQGQLTLSLPFGPKTRPKVTRRCCPDTCDFAHILTARMLQPVARQEIVVASKHTKKQAASSTFIFVNNLSSSAGTYESPYATLVAAQNASQPGDIIYVFPGDGTTTGMAAGITLKEGQNFWGSGVGHTLATNLGTIFIPNLTSTSPTITNVDSVIVVPYNNNEISGFVISGWTYIDIAGIHMSGAFQENISILSCTISSDTTGARGIVAAGDVQNMLINNVTISCTDSEAYGLILAPAGDFVLQNSIISGGRAGASIYPDAAFSPNLTISNNTMSKTATGGGNSGGMYIQPFDDGSVLANIENNTFASADSSQHACVLQSYIGDTFCVYMTGNSATTTGSSNGYFINNTGGGTMSLSPCNATSPSVNSGGAFSGTFTPVTSCSSGAACP